jgi:hypothetical protein
MVGLTFPEDYGCGDPGAVGTFQLGFTDTEDDQTQNGEEVDDHFRAPANAHRRRVHHHRRACLLLAYLPAGWSD